MKLMSVFLSHILRMVIRDTNCGDIDGGQLLERNVIAQSINTGHDVANIQFDLQGSDLHIVQLYMKSRII